MGLFDSIVEGVAKLIGLEPEPPRGRAAQGRPSQARAEESRPAAAADDEGGVEARLEPEAEPEPVEAEAQPGEAGAQPEPVEAEAQPVEAEAQPIEAALAPDEQRALAELLGRAMEAIPKVVGVAMIDLDGGRVLAWEPRDPLDPAAVAPLAHATAAVFRAGYFSEVERRLCVEAPGPAQQLIATSDSFVHLLVRLDQYPSLALVVACEVDANLGRVLTLVRGMRGATV